MRRHLTAVIVTLAMVVLGSCVTRHDLDPALQPYVFIPGPETLFTSAIADSHLVCVTTWHYQTPQACLTLGELRRIIISRSAGL